MAHCYFIFLTQMYLLQFTESILIQHLWMYFHCTGNIHCFCVYICLIYSNRVRGMYVLMWIVSPSIYVITEIFLCCFPLVILQTSVPFSTVQWTERLCAPCKLTINCIDSLQMTLSNYASCKYLYSSMMCEIYITYEILIVLWQNWSYRQVHQESDLLQILLLCKRGEGSS